jgi:2-iminobutanoate/2-iminopropanoate deaminase
MERYRISTENAGAALGPYSQAIVANGFVFCSGTVGIDPQTGSLPDGVAEQTEQALLNLAGSGILNRSLRQDDDLLHQR